MDDLASWIASAATIIAAVMTASNLGPRITGYGFCVFAAGSVAWCANAYWTGQDSLLLTNAILLLVNIAGVWRWLGQEASYEQGRSRAARRSRKLPDPSLFSASGAIGSAILDREGVPIGRVIDLMMRCDDLSLGYVVAGQGGVAGIGEELYGLEPSMLRFGANEVRCSLTREALVRCPRLTPGDWPARLPRA